jgi:predicted signal transduction protein with EAL and GGDEF domain
MSNLTGPERPAANGRPDSLVIFLHGYGADGNDLIGLADPLAPHLPGTRFLAPRASDAVARIGGDEFVVLLRTVENRQDALRVAEKIREALDQPFELAGQRMEISCSIGIALYPEHGDSGNELSKNADIAMYHAKQVGRDNVQLFHPDLAEARTS